MGQNFSTSFVPEIAGLGQTVAALQCLPIPHEYCVIDLYDQNGRWADSLMQGGDEIRISLDMRAITLFLAASACPFVLVRHGHPSGIASPSRADILTTRSLAILARALGLHLHDHIIEAGAERFSFRDAGLL